MKKYQTGATMWTTLVFIFLLGGAAYLVAIVGNIYMDYAFIKGSMQELVNQSNFKSMNKKTMLSTINKRLTIDNIRGLDPEVITIKREKNGDKYIHLNYADKAAITSNVFILVEFDEDIKPE